MEPNLYLEYLIICRTWKVIVYPLLFGETGWAQIDYVKDIIYSAGSGS